MATTRSTELLQHSWRTVSSVRTRWQVVYAVLAVWLVATIAWSPSLFVAQFISGFVFGMILVMIALGLALILGLMGVINFAHGALFMLGAYAAFTVVAMLGFPFWVALVVAPLAVGVVGALMEVVTLRPLYGEDPLAGLLLTFGLALMFEEAIRYTWGSAPKSYPVPEWLSRPVGLVVTAVPASRIFTVAVGLALVAAVYLLIVRTDFGLTIRAGVQDAEMTELSGVNLPVRFTAMFAVGAALAGLAGVLRSAEVGLGPGMGGTFIIITFVVIVVGGMGSFFGAVVGGLLIGWTRFLVPTMLSAAAAYTGIGALSLQGVGRIIPFVLMIVVLLDRPRGLFGEEGFLE